MNINTVTISGNLTRDPELRATASGSAVCSFSVAVNDRIQENGQWKDRPNYVDCTAFAGTADYLARTLKKGAKVAISGKLRWSQWETKAGEKRSKLEVIVSDCEVMTREPLPAPVEAAIEAVYESEEIPF